MTLIASYITKFGLIQASDSNLTSDSGNSGFGQKVFPITHLNASLAYSGSYSVGGKSVDVWMNDFISGSFHVNNTIEDFCKALREQMTKEMLDYEISKGSILHIVGYQKNNFKSYLQHWHISNVLIKNDGNYSNPESFFSVYCDFDTLTSKSDRELLLQMDNNTTIHKWFINGFAPGRISSQIIKNSIDNALGIIWNNPEWKFHTPRNIFEFSNLVKLYFDFVTRLFPMSDYDAMYIGGEIQTHLIPVPQDLDKDELED